MRRLLGSIVDYAQDAITKLWYDAQGVHKLRVIGVWLGLRGLNQGASYPRQLDLPFLDRCRCVGAEGEFHVLNLLVSGP